MNKIIEKVGYADKYWQQFVANGAVEKGIDQHCIVTGDGNLPDYSESSPKLAMATLKKALTADAYQRLHGRWRKYKYSQKHNTTTLTIRKTTLDRLKVIAMKAGLNGDNNDLVLEYLMSPEEDLTQAKIDAEVLPTALDLPTQSALLKAKMQLQVSTWNMILSQIKYAYEKGWVDCKYIKGKKTDTLQKQATINFMNKIRGL